MGYNHYMVNSKIYENLDLSDIAGEIWLDVVGLEGQYQVSNFGRIKSLSRKVKTWNGYKTLKTIIMKQKIRNGYLSVNGESVHRIVCRAFHKTENFRLHVNHKNGCKLDNRSINLEWCTVAENVKHAWEFGLCNDETKKKMSEKAKLRVGVKNSCWRGYVDINEINGIFICQVDTLKDAANWVKQNTVFSKADKGNISLVCNKKLNSMYGLKFKYNKEKYDQRINIKN